MLKETHLSDGSIKSESFFSTSQLKKEFFTKNGKLHRLDGPALTSYYQGAGPKHIKYYIKGKLHRSNAPAHITYYLNGSVKEERFFCRGYLHNINGPAVVHFDEETNHIVFIAYYMRGEKLSELEYYMRGGKPREEN